MHFNIGAVLSDDTKKELGADALDAVKDRLIEIAVPGYADYIGDPRAGLVTSQGKDTALLQLRDMSPESEDMYDLYNYDTDEYFCGSDGIRADSFLRHHDPSDWLCLFDAHS